MRHLITGFDVGSSAIRVVVTETRAAGAPAVLATIKRPARGLRRGFVVNLEEAAESMAEALRETTKATGLKIRRVVLGLSGISLESKIAEGGTAVARGDLEVGELDINRALDAAAATLSDNGNRSVIHRFPLSFKLDGKKVYGRPEGMKGAKLEVRGLFISYGTQHLKDLIQAMEIAGVEVATDDLVAAPLAGGLVILSKIQKTAGVVLINIGSQTTAVAIFEEGLPLSIQVFPVGSTDITNDIALGLRISLEEAERIKKKEIDPPGSRKKLDEIIDARLSDIFECVDSHLRKLGRAELLPAGVVLSGGGANIDEIEEFARDYLHLPARTADSQLAGVTKNQIRDPAWAVAYGLTLFGEEEEKPPSNIFKYLRELLP